MVRVSVVIPTYDRPAYLAEAIDSVLCQQGADLEVLVADNGNMRETEQVARANIRPKQQDNFLLQNPSDYLNQKHPPSEIEPQAVDEKPNARKSFHLGLGHSGSH